MYRRSCRTDPTIFSAPFCICRDSRAESTMASAVRAARDLRVDTLDLHYETPDLGATMANAPELASIRRAHAVEIAELVAKHNRERVIWDRDRKQLLFLLNTVDSRRSTAELHDCEQTLRKTREFCARIAEKLAEAQDAAGVQNHTRLLHDAALRAHCARPDVPHR